MIFRAIYLHFKTLTLNINFGFYKMGPMASYRLIESNQIYGTDCF